MPFSFLTQSHHQPAHGSHQHAEHGDGDGEEEDIHADSTLARTSLVYSIPHNTLVPVNTTGVLSGHLQHAPSTTQEATDDDDDDDDDITDAENANFVDVGISPTSHNGDVERQPLITTPEQWCAVRDNNVDSNNIYIHQGGGEPPKNNNGIVGTSSTCRQSHQSFQTHPRSAVVQTSSTTTTNTSASPQQQLCRRQHTHRTSHGCAAHVSRRDGT
ncbi:hypothetical protein NFJ02_07g132970 [Pycnococcus provasolii]